MCFLFSLCRYWGSCFTKIKYKRFLISIWDRHNVRMLGHFLYTYIYIYRNVIIENVVYYLINNNLLEPFDECICVYVTTIICCFSPSATTPFTIAKLYIIYIYINFDVPYTYKVYIIYILYLYEVQLQIKGNNFKWNFEIFGVERD